jgi:hypothetical protein
VEEQEDQELPMALEEVLEEEQDFQLALIIQVVRLLHLGKVMLEVIHLPTTMVHVAVVVEQVRLGVIQ